MLKRAVKAFGSFRRLDRNLLVLFAASLVIVTALQLVQPLFPVYLQSLGASEVQVSLIISISGVAGTLMLLPVGVLIERLGEKRMMLTGVALWGVSTLAIALTGNLRAVAIIYSLYGAADAFVGPSRMTLISGYSTPSTEATVFSLMSLDWTIAGIIVPTAGGYLADRHGWQTPLLAAAAILLLSLAPIQRLKIRQTPPKEPDDPPGKLGTAGFLYFTFGLLTGTAISMMATMLPLYLANQLSLSTTLIGLYFTSANIVSTIVQVPAGLLADRVSKKRLITALLLPMPVVLALWGTVQTMTHTLMLYTAVRGLLAMTGPATLAIVTETFPESSKGKVFSARIASQRLGSVAGPLIGGLLYAALGPAAPFKAAGAALLLSIPFIHSLKQRRSRPENPSNNR